MTENGQYPWEGAPVRIPITDALDLHTFRPSEVKELLDDYFTACAEAGIYAVRVVHGKGTGALKKRVRGVLEKHPLVEGFSDAPHGAGGWGATLVRLRSASSA